MQLQIFESLQNCLAETDELQRLVILGPETGARHVSAVLVRVPPHHQFPLHTHPVSEDCFFVLSGAGKVSDPGRTISISEPAAVWVPAGHPHGLATGAAGIIEVGFQSPPDPTAVPFDRSREQPLRQQLLTASVPTEPNRKSARAEWMPVFTDLDESQNLRPIYAVLGAFHEIKADAGAVALLIVIARGAVELAIPNQRRVEALALLSLAPNMSLSLRAMDSPALLLGIGVKSGA